MKVESFTKCYCKKLNGKWTWELVIWFTPGMFADCVVKSPDGREFDDMNLADVNMNSIMNSMKIKRK